VFLKRYELKRWDDLEDYDLQIIADVLTDQGC